MSTDTSLKRRFSLRRVLLQIQISFQEAVIIKMKSDKTRSPYPSRIVFSYHCLEISLKFFHYEKRNTNKQKRLTNFRIFKASIGSAREGNRISLLGLLPDFFENKWSCYLCFCVSFKVFLTVRWWRKVYSRIPPLNGHRRDRRKMTTKGVGDNSGRPSLRAFCCRKGTLRHHFVRMTIPLIFPRTFSGHYSHE